MLVCLVLLVGNMASKEWSKLLAVVPTRAAEMLADGLQAMARGETCNPHRWAFVDAMKWAYESGLHRGSLQYRFAEAVMYYMKTEWAKELD